MSNFEKKVKFENQIKLSYEQQISRIEKVYGVSFSKKHKVFLKSHGYDYIVRELIITHWNNKNADFLRNRLESKLFDIQSWNKEIQLTSTDIYYTHELIEIYKGFIFKVISEFEQLINTLVLKHYQGDKKIKAQYSNRWDFPWLIIPGYSFVKIIEIMKKQNLFEVIDFTKAELTKINELRNNFSHWTYFLNDKEIPWEKILSLYSNSHLENSLEIKIKSFLYNIELLSNNYSKRTINKCNFKLNEYKMILDLNKSIDKYK